jgi:hypothetical protein
MDTWSNEELLKIIRLIAFQPAVYPQSAHLRIHGDQDDTNYLPDEECIVIEGGNHFIQHTHAGFVAQKITNWVLGL